MIAIEVNDPENKLLKVLNRAMENEPDAQPEDHKGHRIWKVSRDDEDLELEIDSDFGDFGKNEGNEGGEEDPLLNNWAIAKYNNYLFFASHFDLIREVIDASTNEGESKFFEQADVAPVAAELDLQAAHAAWRIMRADRSLEMQYELFRRDELPQSQTIIAVLLDRLLRPRTQAKQVDQKVKGNLLPEFQLIRQFLLPIGYSATTTDEGWKIRTFIVKPKK